MQFAWNVLKIAMKFVSMISIGGCDVSISSKSKGFINVNQMASSIVLCNQPSLVTIDLFPTMNALFDYN